MMMSWRVCLVWVFLAAFARESLAQATVMPSDAAIEKAMREVEAQRKGLFAEDNPKVLGVPQSFPSVSVPTHPGIDIEALARRYEARADVRQQQPNVLVFASLTMPKASLKRVIRQAHQIGAAVVFRGFKDNSLKATTIAIRDLGEESGHVIVNPKAFTQYKIETVPTLVMTRAEFAEQLDGEGCALPENYVAIAGDVSLDFGLEAITRQSPAFAALAAETLQVLRGEP